MKTDQGALTLLCGREGNRRFGLVLAMPHNTGMVYPPTGSRRKGDER